MGRFLTLAAAHRWATSLVRKRRYTNLAWTLEAGDFRLNGIFWTFLCTAPREKKHYKSLETSRLAKKWHKKRFKRQAEAGIAVAFSNLRKDYQPDRIDEGEWFTVPYGHLLIIVDLFIPPTLGNHGQPWQLLRCRKQ